MSVAGCAIIMVQGMAAADARGATKELSAAATNDSSTTADRIRFQMNLRILANIHVPTPGLQRATSKGTVANESLRMSIFREQI